MYRKGFRRNGNNIPSIVLMIGGVILIAWWMPLWVWFVMAGVFLIVICVALYQ